MAQDLQDRVVTPTLAAGALFDAFPYLTRLYTTLSPEDMNKDPVFSFNPGLKDWPNVHDGTLTYHCGFFGDRGIANTAATLRTEAGWVIDYPERHRRLNGGDRLHARRAVRRRSASRSCAKRATPRWSSTTPPSISHALGGGGCGVAVGGRASRQTVGAASACSALAGLVLLGRRRRAR